VNFTQNCKHLIKWYAEKFSHFTRWTIYLEVWDDRTMIEVDIRWDLGSGEGCFKSVPLAILDVRILIFKK